MAFANGLENFATSMTNMDKKTMNKMMCNIANWALLYAPRDENDKKICDVSYEHYQCDCSDPKKYNFVDEDLCNWFKTSQTSFLNNDDGIRKCEIALACGSPLPAECKMEESDESDGPPLVLKPPTSKKWHWGTFVAIAFGIIVFFTLFVKCLTFDSF